MQRFLFDRLCQPKIDIPDDVEAKLSFLRQSITENLTQLVSHRSFFSGLNNAVAGTIQTTASVLNFGLSDIVSHSANFEDSNRVKEQIRQQIQVYEPRLLDPEIKLVATKDPLMPAMIQVNGTIKSDELEVEFCWKPLGTRI
ncbi:type VI secretion system baseplate subunit TssE [Aliikangiella sp. IMCC44359]|uniref:type VI secretion system baseplate subunit TssE n=1 Tax=Aliikangiella sp. IMCC44359 TaxID=3459125 RepID=UPI00403A88C4